MRSDILDFLMIMPIRFDTKYFCFDTEYVSQDWFDAINTWYQIKSIEYLLIFTSIGISLLLTNRLDWAAPCSVQCLPAALTALCEQTPYLQCDRWWMRDPTPRRRRAGHGLTIIINFRAESTIPRKPAATSSTAAASRPAPPETVGARALEPP